MKFEARLAADGEPDGRDARRSEKLALAYDLLVEPRPISELAERIGCSDRTVYLLIEDLEARGVVVARVGTGPAVRWVRLARG